MRPTDLPVDIGLRSPHGTRSRYVGAGCRCEPCREANRAFAHTRAIAKIRGDWNGIVSAKEVRRHLLKLRKAGVGRRSVADIVGVSETSIQEIIAGRKKKLRARTAKRILAVTVEARMNDATLVPAGAILRRLAHVRIIQGWTCKELARRLGYRGNAIQFRDPMTARNARKVELFLRHWTIEGPT